MVGGHLFEELKLLNHFYELILPKRHLSETGELAPDVTQWSFSCSASNIFQHQHSKKVCNEMDS